jgi:ribonuclease HI
MKTAHTSYKHTQTGAENNLTATLKCGLHRGCSNNQAEQMAILKALEYIQY